MTMTTIHDRLSVFLQPVFHLSAVAHRARIEPNTKARTQSDSKCRVFLWQWLAHRFVQSSRQIMILANGCSADDIIGANAALLQFSSIFNFQTHHTNEASLMLSIWPVPSLLRRRLIPAQLHRLSSLLLNCRHFT